MPRGFPHHPSLRQRARELRSQGLKYREIGEQFGVPPRTVASWVLDPDGRKKRARVARYAGVCECCGGPTDGANGAAAAPRECMDCITWTEDMVLEAMREWAETHDGAPPRVDDWREKHEGHPTPGVGVIRRVGWNNLLLQAGFELRTDRRPETQETMERMLREGCSTREVAEHFGWCVVNVHDRMRRRGLRVSDLRPA